MKSRASGEAELAVGGAARAALTGPVQQRRADLVQDGEGPAVLAVIGTVVCADSFSRSRRDLAAPAGPGRPRLQFSTRPPASKSPATTADAAWLQPYPDVLLDQIAAADPDPAGIAERRESVALAFIAALQLLPARQRAVLILRDVLAWPARDVAGLLDNGVASVNSALQRARTTVAAANPAAVASRALGDDERQVLDSFVRAWQACDIPALAALLRDDATLTMPPQAIQVTGRRDVARFFATVPAEGRLDLIRLVRTRANGHPAVAAYLPDDKPDECHGYGRHHHRLPCPRLFPVFGLPLTRQ